MEKHVFLALFTTEIEMQYFVIIGIQVSKCKQSLPLYTQKGKRVLHFCIKSIGQRSCNAYLLRLRLMALQTTNKTNMDQNARTTDAQKGNSLHCMAKVQSQSQIFRYGGSIFCLPHRPNFSDIFDLCLHCVSVVRVKMY